MEQDHPKLRQYSLLLQLGHTTDYQVYLGREEQSAKMFTLRQARRASEQAEHEPLEAALKAIASEPHPHLPNVVEVGTEEGALFWVSDYEEGELLAALERRSVALTTGIAMRLCLDVGSALQELVRRGSAGPILREDVLICVDGNVRVVPPLSWSIPGRREIWGLAETLRGVPSELVFTCSFIWELFTGVSLTACFEEGGAPPISTLAPQVPDVIDDAIRRALDPRSGVSLALFLSALGKETEHIAQRSEVRDWLLKHIASRLQSRAHVLRSKYPGKLEPPAPHPQPSAPDLQPPGAGLVPFTALTNAGVTERPLSPETLRTPPPFAADRQTSATVKNTPSSSAPTSSVRGAPQDTPSDSEVGSRPAREKPTRAPLETALAEYAERISRNRSGPG